MQNFRQIRIHSSSFTCSKNNNGKFISKVSEEYYDRKENTFLADRYIKGKCPKCQYPEAFGDQCEKCGSALSPLELVDPVSAISGKVPILKKTEHWYLPMQNHEEWLKKWQIII